jgi:hypothetical protein
MAFSYDPTTDAGLIRLLIADTDEGTHVFSDAEIAAVYAANANSVKATSAQLLEALAANHAKLAIKVGRGDVDEDLTKVASELRAQAALYRAQADAEDEGVCIEAVTSPSYERFSYTTNELLEREDEVRQ